IAREHRIAMVRLTLPLRFGVQEKRFEPTDERVAGIREGEDRGPEERDDRALLSFLRPRPELRLHRAHLRGQFHALVRRRERSTAGFLSAVRRTSRETCYVCGCAEYATLRATPACID